MISSIQICVATDKTGGFAKNNSIPWNIPEDFKHFINTTKHSWCITGKNSYLEMVEMKKARLGDKYDPSAPILKDRVTFVVSSTLEPNNNGDAILVHPTELDELIERLDESYERRAVFILGGKQLYDDFIDRTDKITMTHIDGDFECDRHFPIDKLKDFDVVSRNNLKSAHYDGDIEIVEYLRA